MKITDKTVSLLTDRRCRVPLVYINFNHQKYIQDGAKGGYVCSVHPELAHDEELTNMLNKIVDYIRGNYDMNKLVEL